MNKSIDILCIGEVLVDFIGHQQGVQINKTKDFHRYLGGSPTNVAMNSARLGLRTVIVASIGKDGFGEYVLERLKEQNVIITNVKEIEKTTTSVIFISRSDTTPEFIPFRNADYLITEDQISKDVLKKIKIFHTTCFALSKNPAQTTILKKAAEAFKLGCKLSIDFNYSSKIWSSKIEALKVIKAYCKFNPLVKVSEDDMYRLFNQSIEHKDIFNFFHTEGVDIVCLTLGSKGVKLSERGKKVIKLPAIKIEEVKDTTGAGDAFWSGFLYAYIKKKTMTKCLDVALKLAALKLQNVGRLPINANILSKLL